MALVPGPHTPCDVPVDFNREAFHEISSRFSSFSSVPAWASFASALNGMAFRFAATDESHERFVSAITEPGALSPSGGRYRQEEALFSFFVNACSTLDAFYFAFYNVGGCMRPSAFPVSAEDLRIDSGRIARSFGVTFPLDTFSVALRATFDSREFKALAHHRHFLAHRGAPPRRHDLGFVPAGGVVNIGDVKAAYIPRNPREPPGAWISDLSLAPQRTAAPRAWLGRALKRGSVELSVLHREAKPAGDLLDG
jgi:hypothetical protein